MKNKNVLIAPSGMTLSERAYAKIYNLVRAIASANTEISYEVIVNRVEDTLPLSNVNVHSLNADLPPRWKYHLNLFKKVDKKLSSGDVDLYHHMDLSPPWFNPILLKDIQTKSVIGPIQAPHSVSIDTMGNVIDRYTGIKLPRIINQLLHKALPIVRKIIDMVRRVAFRRNLHTADEIVVVNQAVADYCSSFLRDERNISIIPYGVDIDFFEFTERDTECMDLVAIGLLKKRKGFADLLKAFSTVVNSHPDAHLHIFGKGPQRTALEQLASENGISEAVTFHGFVAHATIREFLTKCRMFIHPSHSEGYSHVRLEALASGCPIVGTDIAGADGMILDGETGLTVQPGDIDGLAESISQLMSKDELLTEMSHNARSHVEENYSFDTIGEKWVEVYQSALGTELY